MRAARRKQTFNISRTQPSTPNLVFSSIFSRNLQKYQLGGVIFGCKNSTMKECQSKQIFGLPAQHFSYVKNIDPGLPIFLFNYSDRKLHGIFEASSKGQMYIDPYAWIDDSLELDKTQYPAQVKFRVRLQCQPLSEDKFAPIIKDNYYTNNHFWFELDHRQACKLISLLASLAFAAGCNLKWRTVSPSLPSTLKGDEAFVTPESETHHFTSSNRRTNSTEITSYLDEDIKSLDIPMVVKEVNENEMNLVYEKLKELALGHESQDLSILDNVNDTLDENDIYTVEKDSLEVSIDLEKKEESSGPPIDHQNNINQLVQEVEELTTFKKIQIEKNYYLEEKLRETLFQIQHLMDRCTMLESTFNYPTTHVDKTIIQSSCKQHVESLLLQVNSDEKSWLSTMNLYCSSENVTKSLYTKNTGYSYASTIQLNDGSYSPILNKWTLFPSLNEKKNESLTVNFFTNKMLMGGGADEIHNFSDIELLDLDNGKCISTCLMLHKGFAIAAVELKALLYTIGNYYLQFVLLTFDESKMVPSIKVFHPSFDMDYRETTEGKILLTLSRNIYVIEKVKDDENIVDMVSKSIDKSYENKDGNYEIKYVNS